MRRAIQRNVEDELAAGKAPCLSREVEQVPAGIGDDVLLRHGQQLLDLAQVAEHAFGAQLMHHRVEERLLSVRAVQVAIGQPVALPDERQCLRGVQVLVAGVEVSA